MPTRLRACWLVWALALAAPAVAQVRVDALTEVRKIRFEGHHELTRHKLESTIRTQGRGASYGLRVAVGKLPFVPGPGPQPFSPLTLQEDVVRLRSAYAASGFFATHVRYTIVRDDAKNLLDITFVIVEGPPTLIADVTIRPADTLSTLPVPDDQQRSWKHLERSILGQRGHRLIVDGARKDRDQLKQWWRDRGYPRADVTTHLVADTTRSYASLAYRIAPGPFARFGEVEIEGNKTISDAVVQRQVNIHAGEPYSAAALKQAALDLQELDIIRVAHVDAPTLGAADSSGGTGAQPDSTPVVGSDSLPPVRVRITEADRRLVSGDLGYVTDAGLSAQARWTHRNFSGGGRSLTVTTLAQTGWLALTANPDERYRFSVSLKQPAVLHRRVSAALTPFVEHRDDTQDRSTQYGLNTTLIYKLAAFRSVSLDYQVAWRHIDEYHLTDLANGDIDLFTFLVQASQGQLDSLGSDLRNSTFTLSGSVGAIDDPANPRRGFIVRPAVQVTAPTSMSSTAYWRMDASANGFVPLGKSVVFASRFRVGRLFPFGKSLPGPGDDPQTKFLQLRDASFTAGGTSDVRGWENRLLGPKVPDVRFTTVGDSLVPFADGYVPYGGFDSGNFSLELQLPVPGVGPNVGWLVFLDGGRVWTDDARFGLAGKDPNDQERFFFATGAGISLRTPVGPIELSTGYKLNPSITDLASSEDLLLAAREGRPLDTVPRKNSRRWQLHLAIGSSY
jgi:outer membrane protein assembly factor BamA